MPRGCPLTKASTVFQHSFEWPSSVCFCRIVSVLTISSIFRILRTVSDASWMALVDTSSGCRTFSSRILVMVPWKEKRNRISIRQEHKMFHKTFRKVGKKSLHMTLLEKETGVVNHLPKKSGMKVEGQMFSSRRKISLGNRISWKDSPKVLNSIYIRTKRMLTICFSPPVPGLSLVYLATQLSSRPYE